MMDSAVNVRNIAEDDIEYIVAIEKECFGRIWSEKNISDSLSNPRDILLCIEIDGEIAGYIFADYIIDEVNINRIAVKPTLRNNGYAGMLLKALENKVCGFAVQIMLEVRQSNLAAQNLYLKNGYRQAGLRKRFYTEPVEDALLMKKTLKLME